MNTRFDDKIFKRSERMIASPVEVLKCGDVGPYTVVTQRNFKGICREGTELVAPIFDDIKAHAELNVAAVMMEGLWAIIDIFNGTLLTDFEYDDIEFAPKNHSVILIREGKKGLFDVVSRSISLGADYEEISKTAGTRFSWTYSPLKGYDYYDSQNDRYIHLGHSVDECFDEFLGHIFVVRNGIVQMLTSEGLSDTMGYRRLLASHHGRLTLYNSTRGVSVVADIYGHIL